MNFGRKQIASTCLALWIGTWLLFSLRSASFPESSFRRIGTLIWLDAEGRQSAVYGKEFMDFMAFCREKIPAGGTFLFLGPDDQAVSRPRAYLELLPRLPDHQPEFLIIYRTSAYSPAFPTVPWASFSPDCHILRKKECKP